MQPRSESERALVIGIGNPSRQDDAAGYWIAQQLSDLLNVPLHSEVSEPEDLEAAINVMWAQQLLPEMAELFAACDLLILVDAHTGDAAKELDVVALEPAYHTALVSHHLHPETVLAMARDLYKRLPRAILISVRGYEFDFGTELSPRTRQLAEEALRRALQLLNPGQ